MCPLVDCCEPACACLSGFTVPDLGWLLGDRFLMLTHTGRKSGRARETVIEVVRHDRQADTYYVVSGWGEKADWYQNIRKSPRVAIHVGGRKLQAEAEFIPVEKAIDIMEAYATRAPDSVSGAKRAVPGRAVTARQRRSAQAGRKDADGQHSSLCKPGKPIASPNPGAVGLLRPGPVKHCLAEQEQEVK